MRDIDDLFAALETSRFRSRFTLAPKELEYLRVRGRLAIAEHARRFVGQRLSSAAPRNDGRQTPLRGHPVFVAQHATATCCRSCLAKWHGIGSGRALDDWEQEHVVAVILRWLTAQLEGAAVAPSAALPVATANFEPDDSNEIDR